jgi:hypothetical protein
MDAPVHRVSSSHRIAVPFAWSWHRDFGGMETKDDHKTYGHQTIDEGIKKSTKKEPSFG